MLENCGISDIAKMNSMTINPGEILGPKIAYWWDTEDVCKPKW